jgi:protein O-GlcNAc transferase
MESVSHAVELYRRGSHREAEVLCEALLAHGAATAECLALIADIRLSTGRPAEAIGALTMLTDLMPGDAANLRRLGAALLTTGRPGDAVVSLSRAAELEPGNVRAHNNLGQALLQTGNIAGAIRHLERALALDPAYAVGHNNLGLAWTAAGEFDKAVASLQCAIGIDASLAVARLNLGAALERLGKLPQALEVYELIVTRWPEHVDAWIARGTVLLALCRAEAALGSFDAALKLRPGDAQALARKGSALLQLERAGEALGICDQALRIRTDFAEALDVKAAALCRLNRPAEALGALQAVVALKPDSVEAWCELAVVHQNLGDDEAAVGCLRRAVALDEDSALARGGLIAAQIPSVAESEAESSDARRAFEREMDEFAVWLGSRKLTTADAWTVARQPFFYLSYQEECNKALLQRYRRASSASLSRLARPHDESVNVGDRSSQRFKVGFVSAQIYDHSVFNALLKGWLQGLDRQHFEISLFSLGTRRDASTESAAAAVDDFDAVARTVAEWADAIALRRLDAVIFPEVGIDRNTLALANVRLAPRQFASWGHPETSGLPTIDGFLSADAFEPEGAQDHYSERLVRLPNLGVHYDPPAGNPTPVELDRLGIPDDVPLLICPGTPFKYRPQDDAVWVEIARRLGRCTLAFFRHERADLSDKLHRRLTAAFAREGLDAGRFLKFLPWLPRAEFLGLMRRADVYLDTPGFSGFNTFMQAVQAHLPGVAFEGRFMRGRLGSGILRGLGLSELVAATAADYVAIAVHLAEDPAYRARIRAVLRGRETQLYRDRSVLDALSEALTK